METINKSWVLFPGNFPAPMGVRDSFKLNETEGHVESSFLVEGIESKIHGTLRQLTT